MVQQIKLRNFSICDVDDGCIRIYQLSIFTDTEHSGYEVIICPAEAGILVEISLTDWICTRMIVIPISVVKFIEFNRVQMPE